MIRYQLQKNAISTDPNARYARVIARQVYTTEDLIRECLRRGSTVTEADLRATITLLFSVMIDAVQQGNFLNTPVVNLRPSITGTFSGNSDTFDHGRHRLGLSASAGTGIRRALVSARVDKVLNNGTRPVVVSYRDAASATENGVLSPGSIGSIEGRELDFDPAHSAEGVFFRSLEGDREEKAQLFQKRTRGNLVFMTPDLPAGFYRLIVRKAYTAALEIREGILDKVLLVT